MGVCSIVPAIVIVGWPPFCWGLRTSKPNGFVSRSPGLLVLRRLCEAGQATLGAHVTKLPQPQRGCVLFVWLLPETSRCGINRPKTTQPRLGLINCLSSVPRVARRLATRGFGAQTLQV